MALLWRSGLARGPSALEGNQGPDGFTVLEARDPARQATLVTYQGQQALRAECRYGDNYTNPNTGQRYTEQRCLLDVAQVALHEGDESWTRLRLLWPADWRGWFPKYDELGNWPGNPRATPPNGGYTGGTAFEWHHAPEPTPPYNGDWSKIPGSAPMYLGATDRDVFLELVDVHSAPRADAYWRIALLQRDHWYEIVLHVLWSASATRGIVEVDVDGKNVVRAITSTLFPGCFVYPVFGLYRRENIGNRSLTWPSPPKPGVQYPDGFTPQMGVRVYPDTNGYPQAVYVGESLIGTTKEDVMANVPSAPPAPSGPSAPAGQTPSAPKWLYDGMVNGLRAQIAQVQAAIDAATTARDNLQAELNTLNAKLDSGEGWLTP